MNSNFFSDGELESGLEESNQDFWSALLDHIENDLPKSSVKTILDVGCHSGGLLKLAVGKFSPEKIWGIEPAAEPRKSAELKLRSCGAEVVIGDVNNWSDVPAQAIDLLIAHEMIYLIPNLDELMRNVARVLAKDGGCYIVTGCHTENPVWQRWREELIEMGIIVYNYSPLEILAAGTAVGLSVALRPLRRDGWIIYNPNDLRFGFQSAKEMLDHHFRHKLLFRFFQT